METTNKESQQMLRPVVLTAAIVGILAFLLAAATDFAEIVWEMARPLEVWQFDEVLMALAAAALVGLLVAVVQIKVLAEEAATLRSRMAASGQPAVGNDLRAGVVVKCSLCSKYQVDADRWASAAEFLDLTYGDNVISGVCPGCRIDLKD